MRGGESLYPDEPSWAEGGGNQRLWDFLRVPRHSATHLTRGVFLNTQNNSDRNSIIPIL